jgi:hypothetical protein
MWLDAPGLALVLLGVSVLDWCWLRRFLTTLLHVIITICKDETPRLMQCMGCKESYAA